ncbi:FMN-dependent oxidoreductase (nitrilotriacetate monooxygenase family) [Paenibacillus cellulosilyticus]|uniref:FMN-dependent oxidoreductase (Nitrilotriacetate monooxygenase family) n=1 Tax=Paenibacillus cellulosilyticus TaxID=375489 RepID=A0A2V2YTI0_9BACL|nr:LLM class flavin-dependent oxidoreductase [Paenibacillus cellulosilyticus]PWW02783.1 FMN-dependent oxidoreductase (nitrilotriacetate monooxygenase family) [Paenibacillus cellulosilyticus]QKS45706.1 LLM class flavin-dependent oxidoreductase [Paenibacillus cellulosilyticus]
MTKKRIVFGAMLHGVGTGWDNWKHPQAVADAGTSLPFYVKQIQKAEAAKFDFAFVADSVYITPKSTPHYLNRFEPLSLLGALAAVSSKIGLVGTFTVAYNQPFSIARQLQSLDHISSGRAGWNVVTSFLEGTASNYSSDGHYAHDVRYRLADEFLDVTKGLWDSWDDDAFIRDKEKGIFYDPEKLHLLHHKGEFFSVKGPLNIARGPQGHPVIFQAGMSEDGKEFAAKHAEAIFCGAESIAASKQYYDDVKARAAKYGRSPDEIFILPGISPIIGDTAEEAEAKYQERLSLITIENALTALGRPFDYYDFTKHDLDAPFPDLGNTGIESMQSAVTKITKFAKENNLTLRQVALGLASPRGAFIGTPERVADLIQEWVEAGAADGFILSPENLPTAIEDFTEKVIPILQERGLARIEYEHDTLRGHLGLTKPASRYTKEAALSIREKKGS